MRQHQVQLPRTPTKRTALAVLKLLHGVSDDARTGFDFKGVTYRCGQWVPEQDLWPTPEYPSMPLVLEMTQVEFSGRGWNRNPSLHVLWRYDRELLVWTEVARYSGQGLDWIHYLAQIARDLLRDTVQPAVPDVAPAIRRIVSAVERELMGLDGQARSEFLDGVHLLLLTSAVSKS